MRRVDVWRSEHRGSGQGRIAIGVRASKNGSAMPHHPLHERHADQQVSATTNSAVAIGR